MLPVGAVVVDFDGTACLHDVAEHLLERFADPSWRSFDEAWERGEIGSRETIVSQGRMLRADRASMLAFAAAHCPIDPTFGPFVSWLASHDVPVTVASDGFGFYVEPLLEAHGIDGVAVMTNEQRWDPHDHPDGMRFVNAHPECVGCGTCKLRAVAEARSADGPVAFVGEGPSDRYGALYADVAFAKDVLVDICRTDGVPFLPWTDFDDVRHALEAMDRPPGPVAPVQCPGWTLPDR
ncbi:MAG TPA: HAD-IB family phosphatase [Actinomycetota bacterium]|jgi:2,3-diketo-5-methylthio-1-phosphopentane phosphatase